MCAAEDRETASMGVGGCSDWCRICATLAPESEERE